MVSKIVDVFYTRFFTVEIDGREVAVALSDDGTMYHIRPSLAERTIEGVLNMSGEELESLLRNQPDFSRQITSPLNTRRKVTDSGTDEEVTGLSWKRLKRNSYFAR